MDEKLKLLTSQWNWADKGIFISAIIIFVGVLPIVKISELFQSSDSWLLILIGLSSLFYFMSVRVNQKEFLDDKGLIHTITPENKSKLSKECFTISIILFILFLSRVGYLLI